MTGGFGDLARDRYSVFGTFDYYKRDHLTLADTDFGRTRDYRTVAGGRNNIGTTTGGTWRQLTATGALTNNFRAISECANYGGVVLTGPQMVDHGLLASTSAQALATNTFCTK